MLGDESLVCEQCGGTSVVTFWRFEGLASRDDRNDDCIPATDKPDWQTQRADVA